LNKALVGDWMSNFTSNIPPLLISRINLRYFKSRYIILTLGPMRIQVRIDPPHPLVCRKRRLNGEVLWMRPEKQIPWHSRCSTIKIPPCSKALSAEHRPKFFSPSQAMVTSPYN
jgi:hypothetical protein